MDQWNEKQLKMMSLGGNKNLNEFFSFYDLNEESVQTRYKTKAAEYYRQNVSTTRFAIGGGNIYAHLFLIIQNIILIFLLLQ
jgi:hypothetical protein